jgi:hypothetical protein
VSRTDFEALADAAAAAFFAAQRHGQAEESSDIQFNAYERGLCRGGVALKA